VVIFPHGDAHIIENGKPVETVDLLQESARIFSQGLKLARSGVATEETLHWWIESLHRRREVA
jgi:hypothetical protein